MVSGPGSAAGPVWDLHITRTLRQAGAVFTLDVHLCSTASRLALLGPSGAGKTQTLLAVAGLTRPDQGHVRLAGRSLFEASTGRNLPAARRRLGVVFQDYALFPHLDVRANVAFGRHLGWRNPPANPSAAARDPTVERWLDAFGLQPVATLKPAELSGGQRQRTALARALAAEPCALLLDEPFAALDRPLRERLREELREVQAATGLPMLLITHDEDDVRALADEAVVLQAGRVAGAAPCPETTA
jgi:molybdate transport system ATP-binding protein